MLLQAHTAALPLYRTRCSFSSNQEAKRLVLPVCDAGRIEVMGGGEKGLAGKLRMGKFAEDGKSYKENFVIRFCEVGLNKTITIESVADLLQETGCDHFLSAGYSTDGLSTTTTMRELGLIWVISRMHIEIYKYLAWGEVAEIETWLQDDGRIGERREWILRDLASSQIIGRATSKWVMMNQETRKLQRISDRMREEYIAYCPRPPRFAFPDEDNRSIKKIPKLEGPVQYSSLVLRPRRSDLDMNQHVNNVTFIKWILESMPQEIIDNYELQTITLDYRRECKHNEVVDSLSSLEISEKTGINGYITGKGHNKDYKQFLHSLRLSGEGPEISRGRTIWKKVAG